jgi:hypothetical protein
MSKGSCGTTIPDPGLAGPSPGRRTASGRSDTPTPLRAHRRARPLRSPDPEGCRYLVRSRGCLVLMDESAQNVPTSHSDRPSAGAIRRFPRLRRPEVESSVRSSAVVMIQVGAKDPLKVPSAED